MPEDNPPPAFIPTPAGCVRRPYLGEATPPTTPEPTPGPAPMQPVAPAKPAKE